MGDTEGAAWGEPPTPGTSKMIAVVLVSASRKGFANSQLAPIPLKSNSGGCWPLLCLIATWSNCPSTRDLPRLDLRRHDSVPSCRVVSQRRKYPELQQGSGWRSLPSDAAAATSSPDRACSQFAPVEPPASLTLLGRGHECVWTGWMDRPDHEGGLRIGRRVDETLEVAAIRKHEGRPPRP